MLRLKNRLFVSLYRILYISLGLTGQVAIAETIQGQDPVCSEVSNHYEAEFMSTNMNTTLDFMGNLKGFDWSKEKLEGKKDHPTEKYEIYTVKIDSDGNNKVVAQHIRWFNWMKKISTFYLLDESDYENFKKEIYDAGRYERTKSYSNHQIRPLDKNDVYDWLTWGKSKVFQYEKSFYIAYDDGQFSTPKDIYKIGLNNSLTKVCSVYAASNSKVNVAVKKPKLLEEYFQNISNIFDSPFACSRTGANSRSIATRREFISNALRRPWAASEMGWNIKYYKNTQKKHFDHWQYKDIWSKREKDTFMEFQASVRNELALYYQNKFNLNFDISSHYAEKILEIFPSYAYSLGSYYHEDKDFSIYQRALSGGLNDWSQLLKLFNGTTNKYSNSFAPVSLFVDYPEKVLNFKNVIDVKSGVTNYGKTLLMYAAHMDSYDAVKWLLDNGWDVNAVTHQEQDIYCEEVKLERDNRSALTYAVENASIHLIKLLIDSGADINIKDSKGNNLDFYLAKNTKFSDEEKGLGLEKLLKSTVDQKISPSFNCSGKLNKIESSICSSDTLSIYDRQLLKEYKAARSHSDNPKSIKKSQIAWIKKRNKECGRIEDNGFRLSCIAQTTRARIRYLEYVQGRVGLRYQ